MEIVVDSKYQDIPALIRYATIVQTVKKEKELTPYADKLISISNKLQLYAYPQNLLNASNSSILMNILKPLFKEQNKEKNVINFNQADIRFIDSIDESDVNKNTKRILDAYNNLFNSIKEVLIN